jgi:hypothetical protein
MAKRTIAVGALLVGIVGCAGKGIVAGDAIGAGGSSGMPQAQGGYWTGPQAKSHKVDLLFVVDNSLAMADKQAFLAGSVPQLLNRLVVPNCVDGNGNAIAGLTADSSGNCSQGTPEFTPVDDLHIGVVTSSLGCRGYPCTNPRDDDHGRLVGSLRNTGTTADGTDIAYPTYDDLGFLAWDAQGTGDNPQGPGLTDKGALIVYLQKMIAAAGEQGCCYESPHEAWYRFLVDPEPPSDIQLQNLAGQGSVSVAITNPPDQAVLTQRAAFLRPDSSVLIVVVSDENDCSVIDYGQGWLVAGGNIPRPTSQCATNPNDPCCRSCAEPGDQYKDCPAPASDPNCNADDRDGNGPGFIGQKYNVPCLRCWQNKRRFGFDLLFPMQRYVNALTEATIANRAGALVQNPLLAGGRSPSLVTLVGIVGVPWQDLTDPTQTSAEQLELMNYDELAAAGRWDVMLGNPNPGGNAPPIPPTDPFMVESIEARSGTNPVTNQPIVNGGTNPLATINGHEFTVNPNTLDDLQYACIFQLPTDMVRDCTLPAFTSSDFTMRRSCDCKTSATDNVIDRDRPLCQMPTGGPAGTQQYFAKAYPGLRHLELLQRLGPRGVVGSICPKSTSGDANESAYGYNAVVNATVARLKTTLN